MQSLNLKIDAAELPPGDDYEGEETLLDVMEFADKEWGILPFTVFYQTSTDMYIILRIMDEYRHIPVWSMHFCF
jgi:hypothetical protein